MLAESSDGIDQLPFQGEKALFVQSRTGKQNLVCLGQNFGKIAFRPAQAWKSSIRETASNSSG
ncbi:MAG: hypothetical protein HRT36_00145 [Alphaproteobacteria bacterium]|nr:hypothetical protein [Alphaproteobacteria bacterium]